MIRPLKMLIFLSMILSFGVVLANAQKTPDYKISNIKIVPFDSMTGEFQEEIKPKDERSFFNDLDISLLATIEIQGKSGTYEGDRKVQITVTEGKKVKLSKTDFIGVLNDKGSFYIPVWLYRAMCSDVKITAKILGQKNPSTYSRTISFQCGE